MVAKERQLVEVLQDMGAKEQDRGEKGVQRERVMALREQELEVKAKELELKYVRRLGTQNLPLGEAISDGTTVVFKMDQSVEVEWTDGLYYEGKFIAYVQVRARSDRPRIAQPIGRRTLHSPAFYQLTVCATADTPDRASC